MEPVLTHPSDLYRRSARQLRGRLGGRPRELYRSLRDLSDGYDSRFPDSFRSSDVRPASPADDFAAHIARKIHGGVLCYSDRLELLGAANDLGIGRFEANLIIAAVQHRLGAARLSETSAPKRTWPAVDLVAAFLVVQILILFLGWIFFAR